MRNLNNKDLFKIMRIVRKAGIKEKIVGMKLPRNDKGEVTLSENEWGIMLILEVVDGAPDAENDIFEFLADIGGVEQKELEDDEFELLPDIVKHLTNQKKFTSFLEQAFNSAK